RAVYRTRHRPETCAAASAAGALVFALHPVQVESVAWASELRGLLCGAFSLLCIWLYLRHVRRLAAGLPDDARGPGNPDDHPPRLAGAAGPDAHPRAAGRSGAVMYG